MLHKYTITKTFSVLIGLLGLLLISSSCTKLISIAPPTSTITTAEVFADSADAAAALLGLYSSVGSTGTNLSLTNGALSIYTGSSADELVNFNQIGLNYLYINAIPADIYDLEQYFWIPGYNILYNANACIEGVKSAPGIPQPTKDQITGEAKFIRALVNFYLLNLFGDIPLVNTTSYQTNALLPRTPSATVYAAIASDLQDAENLLPADYSISGGQKIRANKWAAAALLARVYLYNNKWDSAEQQATAIVNNTALFGLAGRVDSVFLTSSREAILQWNLNSSIQPWNSTAEGFNLIFTSGNAPYYYLSSQLLSAFEPGDQRKILWVNSAKYSGNTYYFPYKYRVGPQQAKPNASSTEFYTVLRLAEQYLIRAEARARQGNNLNGAIDDINHIRIRAGLPPLSYGLSPDQILAAVAQERRIELFAEWGHRWFDLKRTGKIDAVMSITTPQKIGGGAWNSYQQLYPIPLNELKSNPNLRQNPGYN
jgi:hypothetical protein